MAKSKSHIVSIEIYTDGSFKKTKTGDICGYGIYFPNNEFKNVANPMTFGDITNNRAELFAIYHAITLVVEKYTFDLINIYTDSEYSQKSLTTWIDGWKKKNWKNSKNKPVENQDIIKMIDVHLQKYQGKINIQWVRAHTGNHDIHSKNNQKADELANQGAEIFKNNLLK
jgi:ribonuclease HI